MAVDRTLERFNKLESRIGELEKEGGNGHNGDMWQQSVENRLAILHNDIVMLGDRLDSKIEGNFRILAGMIITSILGIASLMAKVFGWL